MRTIEDLLGCRSEMDLLEQKFKQYLAELSGSALISPTVTLKQIKLFFSHERSMREKVFRTVKLDASDCLTQAVLASMLAKRIGIDAKVAVPRKIGRFFHAVVAYPEGTKTKFFSMAGKKHDDSARSISLHELRFRLALTVPFVRTANRARRNVRSWARARRRK